ncbi:MAG: hypothetical protein MUF04_14945, partial [Akkermansiaceae bacterium]|nr:hypothetical protein [Akkermansiaceae bacterium]
MRWISGTTVGWQNCTVTNQAGALWVFTGAGDPFGNFFAGNQFISHGTVRLAAAAAVGLDEWSYTLGGRVEREGGTMSVFADLGLVPGVAFSGTGVFRKDGGMLWITGAVRNADGRFELAGGTLMSEPTTPGSLVGDFVWSGGNWTGVVVVPVGSQVEITGSCRLNGASRIDNHGTMKWNSGTALEGWENSTVHNHTDGLYLFAREGTAFVNFFGGNRFINDGVARHTATGTVVLNSWDFALNGALERNGGTIDLAATATCADGAEFRGSGTFRLTGGTLTAAGEIINSDGVFDFAGGTAASGASPLTLVGDFIWSGGSWIGAFEVPAGSELAMTGYCRLGGASRIDNHGTVKWNSDTALEGWENCIVQNHTDGLYLFAREGSAFMNFFGGNRFINDGVARHTATGTVVLNSWDFVFNGAVERNGGVFELAAAVTCADGAEFRGAGTFRLTGGTLTAAGEVINSHGTFDFVGGTAASGASAIKLAGDFIWSG